MSQHIKFPDIEPVILYTADGSDTEYDFPFPVFASEDIAVYFNGAPQNSGFTVLNAGESDGGTVRFDTPPPSGLTVRIAREMPLERLTDFLEGGNFSAQAINTEFDFLIAALQQVRNGQRSMLRYAEDDTFSSLTLPLRQSRANKVLGFDGNGNPVPVSAEGTMAQPSTTTTGPGAVVRTLPDKVNDFVSVKDYGAVGNALADDTLAFQQALAAHQHIYIPAGTYLISAPLRLKTRQSLMGGGQSSVLKCQNNSFPAIEVSEDYITAADFRIEGGAIGIRLFGENRPCVQTSVRDIHITGADIGLQLDGYTDPARPCYWNNFHRILVESPAQHGIHLTCSGAGDTPNANRFHAVRVQSKGVPLSGSGFYVEKGSFNNSFIDCESNVDGTGLACFHLGDGSNKTLLINPYAESTNLVPNVRIDAGARETSITNLLSASDGAAIYDFSGGDYEAYNAGYPEKNKLRKTVCSDLKATLLRYDTEFVDTAGLKLVDLSHSQHIVNATNGQVEMRLPAAADSAGASITIKKVDNTANIVLVTEVGGGPGPDGRTLALGGFNDYATVLSNGAEWFIISSNRMAGNTRFFDGSGTYDIDMAVDVYLLSSYGGAMTARLPPANAAEAIGRVITIKKTDPSSNIITVTEQGGSGPDNYAQPLTDRYDAITVVSNGGQWYIISKFG